MEKRHKSEVCAVRSDFFLKLTALEGGRKSRLSACPQPSGYGQRSDDVTAVDMA